MSDTKYRADHVTTGFSEVLPERTLTFSWIVIAAFGVIQVVILTLRYQYGVEKLPGAGVLDITLEQNIPTWFSSILLFISAMLCAEIANAEVSTRSTFASEWRLIALALLIVSCDEVSGIHERLATRMREWFDFTGPLYFGWVIPGIAGVIYVGLRSIRLLRALPPATRMGMLRAGALYVGAAAGLELFEGVEYAQFGPSPRLWTLASIEEFLEMVAITLFLRTVLQYRRIAPLKVRLVA